MAGAPPDGFLIDGHHDRALLAVLFVGGAPPDGFLIDGHESKLEGWAVRLEAHRLTGFSSMDTEEGGDVEEVFEGAPPDGFLIDGHINEPYRGF